MRMTSPARPRALRTALVLAGLSAAVPGAPGAAAAQEAAGRAAHDPAGHAAAKPAATTGEPGVVPLYRNLGTYGRRITTRSVLAQRYFDQGMRLTYGFAHAEGRRAFAAAARVDSTCGMCHWGIAWALGPYINLRAIDAATSDSARAAIQEAVRWRDRGTAVERALIDAMAARYGAPGSPAAVRSGPRPAALDTAYADAMRGVAGQFPTDPDVGALLGEALMVLRPWDLWTRSGDPKPGTLEILAALEGVLRRDVRHPGACHYYIHATEASADPGRAERCADLFGDAIPAVSHVPHMPSHTYLRVGRYGDAVRANQVAQRVDQRASAVAAGAAGDLVDGAVAVYAAHNARMLAGAAAMDGQGAVAQQAASELARAMPTRAYHLLAIQARFGRWHELLAAPVVLAPRHAAGMSAFARGMGHLGLGRADSAAAYLATLDAVLAGTPADARLPGNPAHPERSLLGIARAILAGELAASHGRADEAIAALRVALPLEDGLEYDEPEPWPIPVRHVLGAVLLESGRAAEAEAAFREDLRRRPRNGWALAGLALALRRQGRAADAEAVEREHARAWARADVVPGGSRVRPGG